MQKKCSKCGECKNINDFHIHSRFSKGKRLRATCKACVAEDRKRYYEANKTKIKERVKKWKRKYRAANPEKTKEQGRRYREANREVLAVRARNRYVVNKENISRRGKELRNANPELHWGYSLKTKYNITVIQYKRMVAEQDGRCAFCGENPGKKRLAVDHCHETGKIRRLLCNECNRAYGLLRESPVIIKRMLTAAIHDQQIKLKESSDADQQSA